MTSRRPDFETLSAYVDGELPPQAAERVVAAAVADPAVARDLAKLQALRAAVASIAAGSPVVPILAPSPPPRRGRALLAAAAVAGVAAAAFLLLRPPGPAPEAAPAASLVAAHETWIGGDAGAVSAGELPDPYGPVLAATGLTLVHSAHIPAADGASVQHYGFAGPRGCRLSLFVQSGAPSAAAPGDLLPDAAVAAWRVGDTGFLIVARGMDPARFGAVFAALQQATGEGAPQAGQRLAAHTGGSMPCRA